MMKRSVWSVCHRFFEKSTEKLFNLGSSRELRDDLCTHRVKGYASKNIECIDEIRSSVTNLDCFEQILNIDVVWSNLYASVCADFIPQRQDEEKKKKKKDESGSLSDNAAHG